MFNLQPQPTAQPTQLSIFGQPQTQQTNLGLQPTQGVFPQQPLGLSATQPLQQGLQPIPQQAANVTQKTDFEKLVKFYQDRPKLTKQQEIDILAQQSVYLKNKTQKKFQKQISIKQTQYLMIDTLSTNVSQLFMKFGLSERNIEYQKDELLRLSQRIKADQQKQNQLYKSELKEPQEMQSYLQLNNKFQLNKNIFNTTQKIEVRTQERQNQFIKGLLHEKKTQDVQLLKSIVFNSHSQIIIDKLFKEQEFFEKLQQFIENQKILQTGVGIENKNYYESIFSSFIKMQSDNKEIMKLLSIQFDGVEFQSDNIQYDLLQNSIKILETEIYRRIGVLDLANLNQKFKDYYYDILTKDKQMIIKKSGQYYPSGILFLLIRCGQLRQARQILFQFIRQEKYRLFFELLDDRRLSNQEKIEQLDQYCDDDLFEQCYQTIFDSSKVNSVFEEERFKQDQDIYLWLTLKTTHIQNENGEDNWLLQDLQDSIPRDLGYRMDMLLLRYENILKQIYQNSTSLLSKIEYFSIYFIIKSLFNIQMQQTIDDAEQIMNSLQNEIFQKYPEIGSLLIVLTENDQQIALEKIQNQMTKFNYGVDIFQNNKLFEKFESILGDGEKAQEFIESLIIEQYQKNLIQIHEEFIYNLLNGKHISDLLIVHKQFINNFDNLIEDIKSYLQFRKANFNTLSTRLYFCSGIVFIVAECQFNLRAQELNLDQTGKGFIKNNNNPKQYYNIFSSIQQNNSRMKQQFDFLQIFNFLIQSSKLDQFNQDKFKQYLSLIDVQKLTQILLQNKQAYLFYLFFWMTDKMGVSQQNMKEIFQKTIHRKQQNLFQLFLINKELNLHFYEIKLMPK